MKPRLIVLIADDSTDDSFFIERAIRKAGINVQLHYVPDGQEALDYLQGKGIFADRQRFPLPMLMLLDLKMPFKSGKEVLHWIRSDEMMKNLPVIIITDSQRPQDFEETKRAGANFYFVKSQDWNRVVDITRLLENYLRGSNQMANPQRN